MRPATRLLGRVALLSLLCAAPARAQRAPGHADVQPVQGLRFGALVPGMPVRIDPGDVGRRGELQLDGRGRYQLQLILPATMDSPAGARLPLQFGLGDAALVRGTAGTTELFDPLVGTTLQLTGGITTAQLFLGGTAIPASDQAAGIYSANVTILLARF